MRQSTRKEFLQTSSALLLGAAFAKLHSISKKKNFH
jgi:hypothetical protein